MRSMWLVLIAVALGASTLMAGEAAQPGGGRPGGRPGGRQGGPGGGPGGFRGGPGGGFPGMGGPREADLFDVARRLATLTDDKKAALGNLEIEYAFAEDDAMAEVRKRLNKEFLARVVALLPDEEKPKYEKAIAAMTERDDAIAAAEKELRDVLAKVKTSQGADKVVAAADPNQRFFRMRPGDVPTRKMDALRTCFVLTDDQRKEIEVIRDGNRDAVREKMRAQFANLRGADGGRPDPEQFRRMAPLFRQVRTETDDADAKMAANLLTEAQKKDFATVCAAIDAYNKKVSEAEAACRTKVTEAVGADKANAILGYTAAAAAQAAPPAKGTEF